MNNNIVCFDVETTGLSFVDDYIIQLSMVKFNRNTFEEIDSKSWYIEPAHEYTITPGAMDVHGITKEFLKDNGVSIKDIAQEIIDFVQDSDYLTYNGNSFDVRFIYKDLEMFGFEFPIEGKMFYDAFLIYKLYHPCNLSAVYKQYTGKDLDNAHDANSDVRATIEVFKHIKDETGISYEVLNDLNENKLLSPEGSIRRAGQIGQQIDHIVFAMGKHKDEEFCEVMKKDPSYIKWYGQNVATNYTKKILNEYFKSRKTL